jgi:outer membrane receptor protein involved in Fe transport
MLTTKLRFTPLIPFLATMLAPAAEQADLQAQIDELRKRQQALEAQAASPSSKKSEHDGHDHALSAVDIALSIEAIGGASSERDESVRNLHGGGHDPKQRGFSMPNAELALSGDVNDYFFAQTNIVYFIDEDGESVVELEEAFIRTNNVPYGLEFKAGQFFTEFGRFNQTHPHQWAWIDQPIVNSRFFGPDGMRGQGARVSAVLPLNWDSNILISAQNARGETMPSYYGEGEGFAGREYDVATDTRSMSDLLWNSRWDNLLDLSNDLAVRFGASTAIGPNSAGSDTKTIIYGAHLALRWGCPDCKKTLPLITWETEFLARETEVDEFEDDFSTIYPSDTLKDYGIFTQLTVGFLPAWSAGLRAEWARGSGDTIADDPATPSATIADRSLDPQRDNRFRLSPLIAWEVGDHSRLRLQYNYDDADHLEKGDAHSVWLALDIVIGSHPEHGF